MKDRYINDLLSRQAYISENMPKKDPFDKAIMKAISSAKESIGMDSDQEDRALRNSILSFGEEMSKMPKRKGFMANFAQAGRALAPALKTHDAYEHEAEEENKRMLEYAQNLRAAEEAKIAQLEANAYQREMADKQLSHQQAMLNEQKRYHQGLLDMKSSKYKSDSELDRIAPKIRTDSAFDKVGLQTRKAAEFYDEVKQMEAKYNDLKTIMQKAGIDTTDPLIFNKYLRQASGFFSSFSKDPIQREIASKYADLLAANKRAMQTAEKALKEGALTNFTVKYGDDNKLYPSFGSENYDEYERKLHDMLDNAKRGYETSSLALQTGRHIDKHNYSTIKELEKNQRMRVPETIVDINEGNEDSNPSTQEEWITIQGPSGQIEDVYFEDAAKFLNRPGYSRVNYE